MIRRLGTLVAILSAILATLGPVVTANARQASVQSVSLGANYTCALLDSGFVRCWGSNAYGETDVPSDLGQVAQVSAGAYGACAVTVLGGVRCWGDSAGSEKNVPSDLGEVTQVSVNSSPCAITVSGFARCWGSNEFGETAVPSDLGQVIQVSAEDYGACAVTVSGGVRCWGWRQGKMGVPSDLGQVTQVSASWDSNCAVTVSGIARCWGSNTNGALDVPSDLGRVRQVSAGADYTCAVTISGTARCWGDNYAGRTDVPSDLGRVTQVTAGVAHTCAVTITGLVRCWGSNRFQQSDTLYSGPYALPPTPTNLEANADDGQAEVSWDYNWDASLHDVNFTVTSSPGGLSCRASYSDKNCTVHDLDNDTTYTFTAIATNSEGSSGISSESNPVTPRLRWHSFSYLDGQSSIGGTLNVITYLQPEPEKITYQWFRDGAPIQGETSDSHQVGFADAGTELSAQVTATHSGLDNLVEQPYENISSDILIPNSPCSTASIDPSSWKNSFRQPSITGQAVYYQSLSGLTGTWPAKTKLCTFWYSGGAVVPNANTKTLKLTGSAIRNNIQFVTVGTSASGVSTLRFSNLIPLKKATFSAASAPKISGVTNFGLILTGSIKNWNSGATYSYQWLRNGSPIEEANALKYKLAIEDLGALVSLRVCGSQWGFDDLCLTSIPSSAVLKAPFPTSMKVSIQGSATKVGSYLSGTISGVPSLADSSIAWLRDGLPIAGASDSSYKIVQADRGHSIGLSVTFSQPGYQTITKLATGKKIP